MQQSGVIPEANGEGADSCGKHRIYISIPCHICQGIVVYAAANGFAPTSKCVSVLRCALLSRCSTTKHSVTTVANISFAQ